MSDWFSRAFGSAVADVRQKLVEEAWFGKTVTPRPFAGHTPDSTPQTFAERMGWDQPSDRERPEPHQPDRERGIDR